MISIRNLTHLAPLLVATLFLVGCGAADDGTGMVSGLVTIDGQPAETGAIAFTPVDGMSGSSGAKIVDGRYEAEIAVGATMVAIRVPKVVGERKLYPTPDSPVQPLMEEALPPRYNDATTLQIEVSPGESEQNFDLSTG